MPYLSEDRKRHLGQGGQITTPGDLTYMLTKSFLETNYEDFPVVWNDLIANYLPAAPRYADYAVVLGCLLSTRLEHWRRRQSRDAWEYMEAYELDYYASAIAPYEDTKIAQNGDCY